MHFETRAIHEGQEPDPATGAITTPIYQTSTYVQEAVGVHKGYDYARVGNPTRTALQECIASLEGAAHGRAFSSGLGAATTLMHLLSPGDHVVAVNDVYGGIYRMFTQVYEPKGYRFTFLTPDEISTGLAAHLEERTKFVWLETPTNPALNIVDIAAASEAAHAVGALVIVDNTFATPYLQQPLALGADVVLHSTTKYLGGHSDVIGGFVATNDDALAEQLAFLQKSLGAVPGPFDAWLVLRGVKTLAVRMDRHCANAVAVAAFLERHPRVERVLYPGLPSHPGHAIAARQMRNFGGMVSFLLEDEQEAVDLVARTKIWKLAESLGGVESLIEHPARMTHASTADAPFAVPPTLIRLSVGIESAEDLIEDLERRARRMTLEPIDLHHQAPGIVGCYLARDGGRARALRLRADDLRRAPEGRARRARARPHRRPAPSALAHPPRPRGRGGRARPRAPRGSRFTSPRSARRTSSIRRSSRRARAGCTATPSTRSGASSRRPGRERPRRRRPRSSASTASRRPATPGTTSRISTRTARSTRATRQAYGSAAARSSLPPCPPPEFDLEAWEQTIARDRAPRARPPRAHPLRRLRRRPGAPRRAARDARPLGRAGRERHGRGRRSSPPPPRRRRRRTRTSPTTTIAPRRTGTTSAASSATGASAARRLGPARPPDVALRVRQS